MLLKVGRHIRPKPYYKLIIGREDGENNYLSGYFNEFTNIKTISHKGPLALIDGTVNKTDMEEAAAIVARYSQGRDADTVEVEITDCNGAAERLSVQPMSSIEVEQSWHV